jgi:hypothetical protein
LLDALFKDSGDQIVIGLHVSSMASAAALSKRALHSGPTSIQFG